MPMRYNFQNILHQVFTYFSLRDKAVFLVAGSDNRTLVFGQSPTKVVNRDVKEKDANEAVI